MITIIGMMVNLTRMMTTDIVLTCTRTAVSGMIQHVMGCTKDTYARLKEVSLGSLNKWVFKKLIINSYLSLKIQTHYFVSL